MVESQDRPPAGLAGRIYETADVVKRQAQAAASVVADKLGSAKSGEDNALPPLEPVWPDSRRQTDANAARTLIENDADGDLSNDLEMLAALVLGWEMIEASAVDDLGRAHRMRTVLDQRVEPIFEAFGGGERFSVASLASRIADAAGADALTRVAVDLWFIDPFAPYEIAVERKVRDRAVRSTLSALGLGADEIGNVEQAISDARSAHAGRSLARVGLFGLGGAVLLGAVGLFAAPVVGGALGAAAGLHGAAAVAHGMALLGGGAVAAGGAGMTGGLWLVAATGGALGGLGAGGGRALYEMGVGQLRAEVVKLQATYQLTLLDQQADMAKAQRVLTSLSERIEEMEEQLDLERRVNDANSERVKRLVEKVEALRTGRDWMIGLKPDS